MTISDEMRTYAIKHPETFQVRRYVLAAHIGMALDMRDCLYPNFLVTPIPSDQVPADAEVFRFPRPAPPLPQRSTGGSPRTVA